MSRSEDDDSSHGPETESPKRNTELELVKTRLCIVDGVLIRYTTNDTSSLRIPLSNLVSIEVYSRPSKFAATMLLVAIGVGCLGYYVSQYNVLTVLLYLMALTGVGLSLIGLFEDRMLVKTRTGSFPVDIQDSLEETKGFVATLQLRLDKPVN